MKVVGASKASGEKRQMINFLKFKSILLLLFFIPNMAFAVTTMEDCERERDMAYDVMKDRLTGMGIAELYDTNDTSNAYYRNMVSNTLSRTPNYHTEESIEENAKEYGQKYFDRCVIDIGH